MMITLENDKDVIVYAVEKLVSFAKENQYLFVANCAWWIDGIIGLDSGLTIIIDNLESRRRVGQHRPISTTP
jgi:polynucleotide 5'-kinase involved in rRNA processing